MAGTMKDNELEFRDWLKMQFTEDGLRRYTDNAVVAYSHALRTYCKQVSPDIADNLFYYANYWDFDDIYEEIINSPNFEAVNRENGNGTFGVALDLYLSFLKNGRHSVAPDISAPYYLRKSATESTYSEYRGEEFRYEEVPMTPIQRIYYGVPGTGKSYTINKMMEEMYPDQTERDAHYRRLIFHPTYTHEDFVGSIKPLVTPDRPLDYVFAPGPLTLLLKDAFEHPAEVFYLVIEEINRGNAPAIFGDLFQLLDRLPNGKSEYTVQNYDMTAYFSRDPGLKNIFHEGKVWFPANFNILATMNTADENIFVLDSAFKRRFALEYTKINFDNLPDEWSHPYDTFAGNRPLNALFKGTALEDYVDQLYYEGKLSRDWPTFARLTNKIIDMINRKAISGPNLQLARIAENKKLGPFFVAEADLCQKDTFLNKVVFYLKQDVFTYSDHYMTESFEEIYMKYIEDDADLFELLK